MQMRRFCVLLPIVSLSAIVLLAQGFESETVPGGDSDLATPPSTCDVTIPNGMAPPIADAKRGWHGNGQLAVALPPDGVLRIVPASNDPSGTMHAWQFWYRTNADAPLLITAQFAADVSIAAIIEPLPFERSPVQPIGITFPREGCWKITGDIPGGSLTTTLWVIKRNG